MGADAVSIATKLCALCSLPIGRRASFKNYLGSYTHRSCAALRDAEDRDCETREPLVRLDGRWT